MKIQHSIPSQFQTFKSNNNEKNKINKNAIIGTTVGTIIPLGAMLKRQKTFNPLKLNYSLKDMLILSASSVSGGTIGGMIGEPKQIKEKKFKEGCYQFINAAIPALLVSGGLKICHKYEKLNNIPGKIGAIAGGIILGMLTANKCINKIFDPKDIHPDREITPEDCIANADDAIGALTLARMPFISRLHIDKALPLLYSYCGYRAGK